jgi:hypothetical protein
MLPRGPSNRAIEEKTIAVAMADFLTPFRIPVTVALLRNVELH